MARPMIVAAHVNRLPTTSGPHWDRLSADKKLRLQDRGEGLAELHLRDRADGRGRRDNTAGITGTALRVVNAIPAVCEAVPGVVSILSTCPSSPAAAPERGSALTACGGHGRARGGGRAWSANTLRWIGCSNFQYRKPGAPFVRSARPAAVAGASRAIFHRGTSPHPAARARGRRPRSPTSRPTLRSSSPGRPSRQRSPNSRPSAIRARQPVSPYQARSPPIPSRSASIAPRRRWPARHSPARRRRRRRGRSAIEQVGFRGRLVVEGRTDGVPTPSGSTPNAAGVRAGRSPRPRCEALDERVTHTGVDRRDEVDPVRRQPRREQWHVDDPPPEDHARLHTRRSCRDRW